MNTKTNEKRTRTRERGQCTRKKIETVKCGKEELNRDRCSHFLTLHTAAPTIMKNCQTLTALCDDDNGKVVDKIFAIKQE